MIRSFFNKDHHVYFDNFFLSPKLLEDLLKDGTYACLTVHVDRKGLPSCFCRKLWREGDILHMQKGNLVYTKWHDKRDINILSSNVDPFALPVVKERWKKNIELVEVQKPSSVEHHNKYMGGDDHSDQLITTLAVHSTSGISICFGLFLISLFAMLLFYLKKMFHSQEEEHLLLVTLHLLNNSLLAIQAIQIRQSDHRKQLLLD